MFPPTQTLAATFNIYEMLSHVFLLKVFMDTVLCIYSDKQFVTHLFTTFDHMTPQLTYTNHSVCLKPAAGTKGDHGCFKVGTTNSFN